MSELYTINYNKIKCALFDFDGTVSLIRSGWQDIMIPYFCEVVRATGTKEADGEIHAFVKKFVDDLTGMQTIYQCMALRDAVEERGGTALTPGEYKAEYLRRLAEKIKDKKEALANGTAAPEKYTVPGAAEYLKKLCDAGIVCYCASGTDEEDVIYEAGLLGVKDYFRGGIHGAKADLTDCSKEAVIKKLLETENIRPDELITFGDGFVEIKLTSEVGGTAIGVATDEVNRSGKIDTEKEPRLKNAGAKTIVPDFTSLL